METKRCHVHDIIFVILCFCLIVFIIPAEAQPGSGQGRDYSYSYFSPSVAIIIAVIMTSLFFMVFFTIYIRQCSGYSSAAYPTRGGAMVPMVHGLDRSIIDTFPTFTYLEVKEHKIVNGVLECAICLNEFEDDDTLRLIPKCDHVFHPVCIDAWLASHITCPVCRANLVTGSGDESVHVHDLTNRDNVENRNNIGDGSNSRDTEVVIQVEDEINQCQERLFNENSSSTQRNVLTRSWSLRPKKFGLGKFRSHSTGHSLVQREKNLERFTLRLSSEVRTVMINRASLNQVSIQAIMLPSAASSKKGFRPESRGEGSSRTGRSDQEIRSDRWAFLTRALSMRLPSSSPRVIEADKDSFSVTKPSEIKTPVKLSSFKCTIEENRSFPDEPDRV